MCYISAKLIFGNYKEDTMKNYIATSAVIALLVPALAQAAPISWSSENYSIDSGIDVDNSGPSPFQSSANLAVPLAYATTITTANGSASTDLSIKSLANAASSDYEFKVNTSTSYNSTNKDASNFYAYSTPLVSIDNSFLADSSVLNVNYDFNSVLNLGASTSGYLAYQDMAIKLTLMHIGYPLGDQELSLIDNHFNNIGNVTGQSDTLSNVDFSSFVLTPGDSYRLFVDVSSILYTTGTVADNSANTTFKVSFSNGNPVTSPVPEPQTYAMLMAGLVLIGFSARKKSNSLS